LEYKKYKISVQKQLSLIFITISTVGIIDVFTEGGLTQLLGYKENYGGDDFQLIRTYYNYVRANAGIGDALSFGYSMAIGGIFFLNQISKKSLPKLGRIGFLFCTTACFLSLTRGAILALVISLIIHFKKKSIILIPVIYMTIIAINMFSYGEQNNILNGRITDSDPGSSNSTLMRLKMFYETVEYIAQNPLGMGIGTQGPLNKIGTSYLVNSDCFILHTVIEYGLILAPIFFYYVIMQFYYLLKNSENKETTISLMTLFLISSVTSSSLAYGLCSSIFWVVCSISMKDTNLQYKTNFKICSNKINESRSN
jgi:O-antigen ligase